MKQILILFLLALLTVGCQRQQEQEPIISSNPDSSATLYIVEDGDTVDYLDSKVRLKIAGPDRNEGSPMEIYSLIWKEISSPKSRSSSSFKSSKYNDDPYFNSEGIVNLVFYDPATGERHKLLDRKARIISFTSRSDYRLWEDDEDELENLQNHLQRKVKKGSIFYVIDDPLDEASAKSETSYLGIHRLYQSDLEGRNLRLISPPEVHVNSWYFADSAQNKISIRGMVDLDGDSVFDEIKDQEVKWYVRLDDPSKSQNLFDEDYLRDLKETYLE